MIRGKLGQWVLMDLIDVAVFDDSIERALEEHHRQWRDLALSTDDLDVPNVQESVALLYLSQGIQPPERLVWLDSPMAGAVAASIFNRSYNSLYVSLWSKPIESTLQKLWALAKEQGTTQLFTDIDYQQKANPTKIAENIVAPVRTQIGRQLEVRFGHSRTPSFGAPGRFQQVFTEEVWAYILARIEQQLNEQDFAVMSRLLLDAHFASACISQSWHCGLGGQDVESLELISFARELGMDVSDARGVLELSKHSSWWWAFDQVCIVTYRPSRIALDSDDRLHCDNMPAIEYADGWSVYARHGNFIPARVAEFSYRKNLKEIENEQSAEIRRHLIDVYGVEQYLIDAEAIKIDEDACGVLYRKDFLHDEPLKMVKVLNSTPEPDGTRKWYYLRVPPNIETAREAVAWTFGLDPRDYRPEVET